MRVTVGDLARGRDNNFNLVRFVAAVAVLFTHSYALTGAREPLSELGFTPGDIAVNVFFAASGFLVTASLLRGGTVRHFLVARALRIYPGLLIANLVTILVIGLGFTTLTWLSYLTDPLTWEFLLRNSILLRPPAYELPGLFASNPFANVVNGSLWTLPYEIKLYVLLCAIGAAHFWAPSLLSLTRLVWLMPLIAAASVAGYGIALWADAGVATMMRLRFGALFFTGASLYLWRHAVRLDWRYASAACLALLATSTHSLAFQVAMIPALSYLVLYLAYVPRGPVRAFNRLGDYSYGTYIYAFPVQQALVAAFPGMSALTLTAFASPAVVIIAMLSWHLVERPALKFVRLSAPAPRQGATASI